MSGSPTSFSGNLERFSGFAALYDQYRPQAPSVLVDILTQQAQASPPKLVVEGGATLRVLRPAKFVDGDEATFTANSKKWSDQTGVAIRVDYLAWDNMAAQTAVAFDPAPHQIRSRSPSE